MKRRGRTHLQNRICAFLNSKAVLGCKVHAGGLPGAKRVRGRRSRYFSRLITGTAKDGRTIVLYPCLHHREHVPLEICEFMRDIEMRCGIVGTVSNIGDSWDVVVDNPEEYKRKQKTFLHKYCLKKHEEKTGNGKSSDSEE